jgi:hypothetical protein
VRATAKTQRATVARILALLCAGFVGLSFNGCAGTSYVETSRTPESRYDIYHGPDYYPYYPYYSYYGGAYYYGD